MADSALVNTDTRVSAKLDKLLELAASRSRPGRPANFDSQRDHILVHAADKQEFAWLLSNLTETGYFARVGPWKYSVTPKGWDKIQSSSIAGIPGRCFVAMSFEPAFKQEYTMKQYNPPYRLIAK